MKREIKILIMIIFFSAENYIYPKKTFYKKNIKKYTFQKFFSFKNILKKN